MTFEVVSNKQNHLVVERRTGRFLGGVGIGFYRPWAFPLYTPRGYTVLQEAPPDHPFHNGVFVGQSPVLVDGRDVNFWATPPRRMLDDPTQQRIGRVDAAPVRFEPHERGVRFAIGSVWRDEHGEPVLDELRTVDVRAAGDATICDMTSRKTATYGRVTYPPTKHGSIGVRVEPRLLPGAGGEIVADGGRRGRADIVHEQASTYVAYENDANGTGRMGLMMSVLVDDADGVWFVRDYGVAVYDSTLREPIVTEAGASWTVGLRVVAYDGALGDERARGWIDEEVTAGDR